MPASIDVYVAAFVARCNVMRRPGQREVTGPGLHGLLPSADDPLIRLLITDDRAYDTLARLLPDREGGMINVFADAVRCADLVEQDPAWAPDEATAMICHDLRTIPAPALPGELTFRPVRRLPGDSPDGVPLEDAAAAAKLAAPTIDATLNVFAEYLRSLPAEIRLFAAVDGDGVVRATSGSGAFGSAANVIFVNTHARWRGRGIGYAMTAAALHAAMAAGARQACLDASDAGMSIYLRLGFEAVTRTTRFFRAA